MIVPVRALPVVFGSTANDPKEVVPEVADWTRTGTIQLALLVAVNEQPSAFATV